MGYSFERREVVRTLLLRDPTHSCWERRHFLQCWIRFGRRRERRRRRAPHRWTIGSCTSFRFLRGCGQLDIVSEVPGESIGFSSDGRLPHTPSFVRAAAWDERCSGVEESCAVSPSRLRGRRTGMLKSSGGEARSANRAAKRSAPSGVSAKPNSRQRCSLTWNTLLAGWQPSKSVELLPFQHRAVPAALRKSSGPASREARILLRAGAGISRIRLLAMPSRAVLPKSDVPPRQPLDIAEVLAKLATVLDKPRSSRSLEEEFGVDLGVATTETQYTDVLSQRWRIRPDWDDRNCHGRCQRRLHARMCSPPTMARCARTERTIPIDQRTRLPADEDDWRRVQ